MHELTLDGVELWLFECTVRVCVHRGAGVHSDVMRCEALDSG